MSGNAYLNLTGGQQSLSDLISQYNEIKNTIDAFSNTVDSYRGLLFDNIMDTTDTVLQTIRADMNDINKYISEFTGVKLDAFGVINSIEIVTSKKVDEVLK